MSRWGQRRVGTTSSDDPTGCGWHTEHLLSFESNKQSALSREILRLLLVKLHPSKLKARVLYPNLPTECQLTRTVNTPDLSPAECASWKVQLARRGSVHYEGPRQPPRAWLCLSVLSKMQLCDGLQSDTSPQTW